MTPALLLAALLVAQSPETPVARPLSPAASTVARGYYYFLQAMTMEDAGDMAGAIDSYRQAIAALPESAEIHAALALLYAGQGAMDDARTEAEAALSRSPGNGDANRLLGLIEASTLEGPGAASEATLTSAIGHLERALAADPTDLGAELNLGRLYVRHGDNQKAIALVQRFLNEEPDYPAALRVMAAAYEANGQADQAAKMLESLAHAPPDATENAVRQIARLEAAERWQDATTQWAALIRQDPVNRIYRTRYAASLANAGDFDKARQVLADATHDSPKNVSAWYLLALVEARAGNAAAADAAASQIAVVDPKDARGPLALARTRIARKDYAGAAKALEPRFDAATQADVDAGVYTEFAETLSGAYGELNKDKRATEVLEQAQKRVPDDEAILFSLAAAYDREKRFADAEKSLRALIKQDDHHADALNYLGYMFAEQGRNLPEAVDLINRALAIERDNPAFLDSLGWAYFKMGDFDKARSPLERAAAALPKASVIHEHLGDLYTQLKRYGDAADAFDHALTGDLDGADRAALAKKRDKARALAGRS